MTEELKNRLSELEIENRKLRLASQQWDSVYKTFREANEKLMQKEAFLSETNERTELALDAGRLAWWDWDYKTGRIQYNASRAELLGFRPEEMPNSYGDLIAHIHPDDIDMVLKKVEKHISGAEPVFEAEYRIKNSRGAWQWFLDKGRVVETDIYGKPVKLAGVLIEIDERKKIETQLVEARDKAESDSRAKSAFLSNMSHEIYTPMAGVIGMAQILSQSKLNQEQLEYLDVITRSATNLMSILNDILEFARLEAGKVEFHEKPFSVHQVVEEITASLAGKTGEKQVEILSFLDPDIPNEVIGDPVRLRQILKVFSDNALKFTEKGDIRIEASFVEWDEETVTIRFSVHDTGIGIPEDGQKKLFQSFSKVDSSESKKYGGGGLGLAIAKRLIDRMNGAITVESAPGVGTDFSFTITFDRYKDSEVVDPMKNTLRGYKVMIIHPDAVHGGLLRNYFERWDCEVEVCQDPAGAMEMIHQQAEIKKPYQLILVEYLLPGTDGLKFASRVKKDLLLKQSPMLLTTSRMAPVTAAELASAGLITSLERPFTLSRLKNRILETISQKIKGISVEEEEKGALTEIKRKALRILLAEDNLINQKVALVTLEKMGHHADLAENGKLALEMFRHREYDLILMDVFMPEMDGLEATREIRAIEAQEPGRFPVQICAITAQISAEDEERCFAAGMNSYISKPFRLEELTHVLSRV